MGLLLRLLTQHWTDAVDGALAAAGFDGIRPHHANVFAFVPPEGIQVSDLAQRAHVRKQTMAETVEQLERAGYVERRPDPNDRRGRLVTLTARGQAVRPVAVEAGRGVEERWAEHTSREELERLRGSLQHLLGRLSAEAGDVADEGPTTPGSADGDADAPR